jgi:hypothetical protein
MSGSSLGNVGVNKVAKEKLNVKNPYGHHWSTWGETGLLFTRLACSI